MNVKGGSPVPDDPTCPAPWHRSQYAYAKHRCRCPAAVTATRRMWRRRSRQLTSPCTRPAARHGWGVDPVAVDRACDGDRLMARSLTDDELTVAVDRLTRHGLSAAQIAARLGVHPRTVQRHRQRLRYEAVPP